MATIVDTLFKDISDLIKFLHEKEEISLTSFSDSNLRKNLLLASASYFENRFQTIIENFTISKSDNCNALVSFLRNKAIKRQYHMYFNWDGNNVNSFLGLFGEDFRDAFKEIVNTDDDLKNSISAFLEVGRERNRLVHQDFGNYPLEKTSEEIFKLHNKAMIFASRFELEINNAT
jgi:hypothetical protein